MSDDDPIQILEVRAGDATRPVTLTAVVTAEGTHAISVALSEQLDRRRWLGSESAQDILALRQRTELAERFGPLARAGGHAVVQLTEQELRDCLLDLSEYRERVDGEHYQPPELRLRLVLTGRIIALLWDANAAVVSAGGGLLSPAPQ
jgi:hypothetical protein